MIVHRKRIWETAFSYLMPCIFAHMLLSMMACVKATAETLPHKKTSIVELNTFAQPAVVRLATLPTDVGFEVLSSAVYGNDVQVLYTLFHNGKRSAYVNGRLVATGDSFPKGGFLSDGRVVLCVRSGATDRIILDYKGNQSTIAEGNIRGPWFFLDGSGWSFLRQISSSRDGVSHKHETDNRLPGHWKFTVAQGKESTDLIFDKEFQPIFSPDSKQYAFIAWKPEGNGMTRAVVVLNGTIVDVCPPGTIVRNLSFNIQGKLCYLLTGGGQNLLVNDGHKRKLPLGNPYEIPRFNNAGLSPDGEEVAYPIVYGSPGISIMGFISVGGKEATAALSRNGKPVGKRYHNVGRPIYSQDGGSLAVPVREHEKTSTELEHYILNGHPNPHHFPYVRGLSFQPLLETIAYIGGTQEKERYILGSMLLQEHRNASLSPLITAPSGRFVTYIAYSRHSFSPDAIRYGAPGENRAPLKPNEKGNIAVTILKSEMKKVVIAAELEGPREDWIGYPKIVADASGDEYVSYIARRGLDLVRVIALPENIRDYDVQRSTGKRWASNVRWEFDIDRTRNVAFPFAVNDGGMLLNLNLNP